MLYEAMIWVQSTLAKSFCRRLCSTQQLVAIVITKAFSTCSTEAVLVLANFLSAGLRAKELAASHSLKTNWPVITFSKSHVTYAKKFIVDAGLQGDSNYKLGLAFDSTLSTPWKPLNFLNCFKLLHTP